MDLAHWILIVGCGVTVFLLMRSMGQIRLLIGQLMHLRQALEQAQSSLREAEAGRVRLLREGPERERDAQRDVLVPLLELDDHVMRAQVHSSQSLEGVREGVELLARDLEQTWERLGLRRIAPRPGEPFDVEQHDAVAAVPSDDADTPLVEQLLGAGFAMGEQLLRPARVVVRHMSVVTSSDMAAATGETLDEEVVLEVDAGEEAQV